MNDSRLNSIRRGERIFCLEFGRSRLKMAYLRGTADVLVIEAAGVYELTQGIIEEDTIVGFIQDFRRRNNVREHQVVVGLARADAVSLNYLTLPAMPDEEVHTAAVWQLKEEIPFDLDQALTDWVTVREFEEDGSRRRGILFAASQRQSVMPILDILRRCHCRVDRLGFESFHFGQCLRFTADLPKVSGVMKIGLIDATLSMYTGAKLNLVRQLPFSMTRLTEAMTGVLVTEQGKVGLDLAQARKFLEQHGIPLAQTNYEDVPVSSSQVYSMMRPHLEALVREIHFSLDYFSSVTGSPRPEVIFLTGDAARIGGLDEYLSRELGTAVKILPLPECFQWDPRALKAFAEDPYPEFLSVFGSALPSGMDINLLPPEIKEERVTRMKRSLLRLMAVTLTGLFLLMQSVLEFRIRDYQARLEASRRESLTLEPIRELIDRTRKKEAVLSRFQSGEYPADGILKAVSYAIPDEIILISLTYSAADRIMNLRGRVPAAAAAENSLLTRFMGSLEGTEFFEEVGLVSSRNQDKITEFEVTCRLTR